MRVAVRPDEEAVAAFSAERITALLEAAAAERGSAIVCLTGGSTPRRLYEVLADDRQPWRTCIPWARVHLFWGDERHVAPDHPDSNFGMADRALVSRVPIPAEHVHRIRAERSDPSAVAREYDITLRNGFGAAGRADSTFDLMLLGLGEDAHVASVFPHSPLLDADARESDGERPLCDMHGRVAAVWAPHLDAWRITLTPAAILDARAIIMIVAGAEKADAVHAALDRHDDVASWPAQLLRRVDGRVEWIMDAAAAARRPGAPRA